MTNIPERVVPAWRRPLLRVLSMLTILGLTAYVVWAVELPQSRPHLPENIEKKWAQKKEQSKFEEHAQSKSALLQPSPTVPREMGDDGPSLTEEKILTLDQLIHEAREVPPEFHGELSLAGIGLRKMLGQTLAAIYTLDSQKISAEDAHSLTYLQDVAVHNFTVLIMDLVSDPQTRQLVAELEQSQEWRQGKEEARVPEAMALLDRLLDEGRPERRTVFMSMLSAFHVINDIMEENPEAFGPGDQAEFDRLSKEIELLDLELEKGPDLGQEVTYPREDD